MNLSELAACLGARIVFAEWRAQVADDLMRLDAILAFALPRIHPKRAFCDVLSAERFEWPPGVSRIAYGPQDPSPDYWH